MGKLNQLHLKIRARKIAKEIAFYLEKGCSIIDIGCGSGWVSYYLKEMGFDVTLADIVDCNQTNLPLTVHKDGLPFMFCQFDAAILVSVLHHSKNPYAPLNNANLFAKKVIIIEETYTSEIGKLVSYAWESIMELKLGMLSHYKFYRFYSLDELREIIGVKETCIKWNFVFTMKRAIFIF